MTQEQISVISNRMKTVVDMYNRHNTITDIAAKTNLPYVQISKILSANGFYHGIKRDEPTKDHPVNPFIFYEDYDYLLDCNILDSLR